LEPAVLHAHLQKIKELEGLDFSGKGEAFVESKFLSPLLECLGYEKHRDYEVIRHGDDGSAFKLTYPPVANGAKKVRHYHPDYTIRKQAFWIIEAKSPTDVFYPFEAKYLVQGFQYCVHPEIQAKYLVVTTGLNTAVSDAHGAVFLGQDMYEPILAFRSCELSQRWGQIYELLSVEKMRIRIAIDLRRMYEKLCLSSLDRNYPHDLIRQIGASEQENAQKIELQVQRLSMEKFARDSYLIRTWKSNLTPDQAYNLMGRPLGWNGTEGVIYVEKSLAGGKSPEEIFSLLTADFNRQSIFRKLQSFAGVCALFKELEAGPAKMLMSKFLEEWSDANLPLLNKTECAWIRVVRKRLVISINSELEQKVHESLRSAPERVRFVLPPTGFNEALLYELAVHEETFRHLLGCTEAELKEELRAAELLESTLEAPFSKASTSSQLYRDLSLTWFQSYGQGGKHFAF
jgi:hypothetical protein